MSSLKQVVFKVNAKIQETTEEMYWDRQDELSTEQLSKIIKGKLDEVEEEIRYLSVDHIMHLETNAREEIVKEFYEELFLSLNGDSESRINDFDNASEMIEELERIGHELDYPCIDLNLKDLIRNTPEPIAHYDTGYSMAPDSWRWSEKEVEEERTKIKKFLGITENKAYDDHIDQMIMQATYGGQLLIYFKLDIDKLKDIENYKSIAFTDYQIGIVEHSGGSGDVLEANIKEKLVLPFNKNNLFLEKEIKYNWTYSIAGMVSNWADDTKFEMSTEDVGEIKTSATGDYLAQEEEYNKTFRAGGCTFGDMDISRHRNTPYINDFPCGNKCEDCGTFWID